MQLLTPGLDFHRSLARNRRRPLANDFTDLAHRFQLRGFFQFLRTILAADATAALRGRLIRWRVQPALSLLRVLGIGIGLAVLRVSLAFTFFLRALTSLALGSVRLIVLRSLLVLLRLRVALLIRLRKHILDGVFQTREQTFTVTRRAILP